MGELEALKALTTLSLLPDQIQDGLNQLSTLSVMTLGPVIAGTRLAKDEIVYRGEEGCGERYGLWVAHVLNSITYQGGRAVLVAHCGWNPWCQAPGPSARHGGHGGHLCAWMSCVNKITTSNIIVPLLFSLTSGLIEIHVDPLQLEI